MVRLAIKICANIKMPFITEAVYQKPGEDDWFNQSANVSNYTRFTGGKLGGWGGWGGVGGGAGSVFLSGDPDVQPATSTSLRIIANSKSVGQPAQYQTALPSQYLLLYWLN